MSQTVTVPKPQNSLNQMSLRAVMLAVALVSLSSLLLELALTRLFSVVLFYHFAFFAISVALLGLGSGGVFAHIRQEWLERFDMRALGAWLCLLNSIFILVFGGSGAAYAGFAGSHGPQFRQADDHLSRRGGAVFLDRTVIFRAVCAVVAATSRSFMAPTLPEELPPAWRLCRC